VVTSAAARPAWSTTSEPPAGPVAVAVVVVVDGVVDFFRSTCFPGKRPSSVHCNNGQTGFALSRSNVGENFQFHFFLRFFPSKKLSRLGKTADTLFSQLLLPASS
jgi:hypothetical protein